MREAPSVVLSPFLRRQRFSGKAVPTSRHLVKQGQNPPLIASDDAHLNAFEQCIREPFMSQLLPRLLALADVVRDGGRPDDFSCRITDRRNIQRNLNRRPSLLHPMGFVLRNSLASPDAGKDLFHLLALAGWEQRGEGAPLHLLARVSSDSLCSGIPRDGDPL